MREVDRLAGTITDDRVARRRLDAALHGRLDLLDARLSRLETRINVLFGALGVVVVLANVAAVIGLPILLR